MHLTIPRINYLTILLVAIPICTPVFSAERNLTTPQPAVQVQPPLEVLWKERQDAIIAESICFNYPSESAEYKGCYRLASKRFRSECSRYTLLYRDSRPYYIDEYRLNMAKFCQAADIIEEKLNIKQAGY